MLEVVGGYALGKAGDALLDRFGKSVIERWTRHRARNFMNAFVEEIAEAEGHEEYETILDEVFNSDFKTEALFEAYRSVSLSKSRNTGPRAIGILTAQIVRDDREITGSEERWFEVFETLSDIELMGVHEFYDEAFRRARDDDRKDYKVRGNELIIEWLTETTEFKSGGDRSPLDLGESLGGWATRLGFLGMIRTKMTEEVWDYGEDSERHVDEPGTARKTSHWLHLDTPDEEYAALIAKAAPRYNPTEQGGDLKPDHAPS